MVCIAPVGFLERANGSAGLVADKTFMLYRNELEFSRKNHPPLATLAFYAVMAARLGLSTLYLVARWVAGRARWAGVRERWNRQWNFVNDPSPEGRGLRPQGFKPC